MCGCRLLRLQLASAVLLCASSELDCPPPPTTHTHIPATNAQAYASDFKARLERYGSPASEQRSRAHVAQQLLEAAPGDECDAGEDGGAAGRASAAAAAPGGAGVALAARAGAGSSP